MLKAYAGKIEHTRIYPIETMLGSLLKSARISRPRPTMMTMVVSATMPPSTRQTLSVLVQRPIWRAPWFCPTKVVQAWLKLLSRL